jgi:hypothetical protein
MTSAHTGTPADIAGTWAAAIENGRAALASRDFAAAYRHFNRAHALGHNDLARHLCAHASLLATARRQRRPGKIARYLLLLTGAALFDRDHSRDNCAVCRAADAT